MENPFKLTKEEEEMLKDGWKKKKTKKKVSKPKDSRGRYLKHTVSSQNKKKVSDELLEFL